MLYQIQHNVLSSFAPKLFWMNYWAKSFAFTVWLLIVAVGVRVVSVFNCVCHKHALQSQSSSQDPGAVVASLTWLCATHGFCYLWELEMRHSHLREQEIDPHSGVVYNLVRFSFASWFICFCCLNVQCMCLRVVSIKHFPTAANFIFSTVWPQILTCSQEVISQVLFPSVFELGVFGVNFKQWLSVKDCEREEVPPACWSEDRLSLPPVMNRDVGCSVRTVL